MSVEIHVSVDGGGDQLPDGPDPAEDPAGDSGGEVEEDSLRCGSQLWEPPRKPHLKR